MMLNVLFIMVFCAIGVVVGLIIIQACRLAGTMMQLRREPPPEFSKAEREAFQNIVDGFQDGMESIWKPGPYIMPPHNKDKSEK